jgi:3-dehydroquinate synthase
LLSQVDASTGGKNGVDLGKVKNVIGTIRQPEFVICDTTMLRTLPEEEYLSGLAELIKTGIIGDPAILDILEDNRPNVILRDRELLTELVSRSVKYKAAVVSRDERETGLRRVLNFGHTFGHAIELQESVRHGFAVASGIEMATAFSKRKGYLSAAEAERIKNILGMYNLLKKYRIPAGRIKSLMLHDKKKSGTDIHFVFIKGLGRPSVEKLAVGEIIDFYRQFENE